MKKLLFLFLLFSSVCNAQSGKLYKLVNGVQVEYTAQEYLQHSIDSANYVAKVKADSTELAKTNAVRSTIISTAQSAVGVRVDQLTAAQVRSLVAILFHREGAIDSALKVKPLLQWVK